MSTQALRERLAALNQSMKHQLAEKGDQTWSKEDQTKFDELGDEAERVQSQLAAHQKMLDAEAEKSFKDAPRIDKDSKRTPAQQACDIFLRKAAKDYSAEDMAIIRNTMSTTTGSEGGFTVQSDVARELINLMKAYRFMRKVASQITTTMGNPLSYPTSDGTSELGELVAENADSADADASFGTRSLNVFKYGSKVITVPIELLQDSNIDIQAMVFMRCRDRIGRIQNQHFTTGTGTGQPTGLVTASGVGKVGASGQVTSVIYDDLVDLVDSLDVAYVDDADTVPGWQFAQTMRRTIRKIKDTAGRPIWTPGYEAGATAPTPDMLLGYPVTINNDMPTPAASAKPIAFGQFSKYMIRDALQVSLFRFDDSPFTRKGQVGFLAWARSGGNLLDLNSTKVYQNAAS